MLFYFILFLAIILMESQPLIYGSTRDRNESDSALDQNPKLDLEGLVFLFMRISADSHQKTLSSSFITINAIKDKETTDWKAINKFTELGTSIWRASELKDIDSIFDLISKLNETLPFLGQISTIISGLSTLLTKQDSDLEKIQNLFDQVDTSLFANENMVVPFSENIEIGLTGIGEVIQIVWPKLGLYRTFLKNPTKQNEQVLLESCDLRPILRYIRSFDADEEKPIVIVKADKYNMLKYKHWNKLLVTTHSIAMFLHTVCMGVIHKDQDELNKNIEADIKYFIEVSGRMSRNHGIGLNYFNNNFFKDKAVKEIEELTRVSGGKSHEQFAGELIEMLSTKYWWRSWLVISYGTEFSNPGVQYVSDKEPHAYSGMNVHNAGFNVYVSSTNNHDNVDLQTVIEHCLEIKRIDIDRLFNKNPKTLEQLFNILTQCSKGNAKGVIKFVSNYKSFAVKTSGKDVAIVKIKPNSDTYILFMTKLDELYNLNLG